ncbi:MAG TPA: Gfo/Idh/MocA family oxidoreductase [Vicinamibacteria bacterium]|nr:Gfo/Idh/MocA family oxidoreductase [Vicinamibacteria bacterium]
MSREARPTSRRTFLKNSASAGAALAVAANRAPAVLAQARPNSVIGLASIGVGTQGHRLLQSAQGVPDTEIRVVCDLYSGNIKRAQGLCSNPKVRIVKEWERVVEDKDVDAVIIAAPDFWHAPITVGAAHNRKDIYVEKGWCTKLEDAKRMRAAVKDNRVVMQLGHHFNSLPTLVKAREIFRSGALGRTPLVRTYIDRTNTFPEWQFYTDYDIQQLPADANEQTIDWRRFVANSPHPERPFDPERFFTWRRYWDYGTGIAGDLLSHIWDAVNGVMEMGIPETAMTQGGKYFWKEDREVPDMWHVLFDYPQKDLAVTFACSFHNRHVGELIQFLGRDLTLECGSEFCRTYTPDWKPGGYERLMAARSLADETRKAAKQMGVPAPPPTVVPDYSYHEGEMRVSSHMENFLDCVRSRELPRCHVDRAFQEAVTLLMSVESYRRETKVRWDPAKEEIV